MNLWRVVTVAERLRHLSQEVISSQDDAGNWCSVSYKRSLTPSEALQVVQEDWEWTEIHLSDSQSIIRTRLCWSWTGYTTVGVPAVDVCEESWEIFSCLHPGLCFPEPARDSAQRRRFSVKTRSVRTDLWFYRNTLNISSGTWVVSDIITYHIYIYL